VPFNYEGTNYLVFRLDDAAVCASVTQVSFIEVLGGDVQSELSSWSCNDNSYLNIYLQLEE